MGVYLSASYNKSNYSDLNKLGIYIMFFNFIPILFSTALLPNKVYLFLKMIPYNVR